jgi:methionyl-tRNA formyltransferase
MRIQQGSTFQEEMVVVLAYRQTIEQTLLEVSCHQHLVPKFLIP